MSEKFLTQKEMAEAMLAGKTLVSNMSSGMYFEAKLYNGGFQVIDKVLGGSRNMGFEWYWGWIIKPEPPRRLMTALELLEWWLKNAHLGAVVHYGAGSDYSTSVYANVHPNHRTRRAFVENGKIVRETDCYIEEAE